MPIEPSELGQLVTLDALLQESSVTGAARRLGLSTPAVSHALAKLRVLFDDPLLVRAGRKMVLTSRAEALKPQLQDLIAQATQLFAPPETLDLTTLQRSFTLSLTDYVMLMIGDHLDELVRKDAPQVDLRCVLNTLDDAARLRAGEIDLAIGIYGDLPPEFRRRQVLTDQFVCVVRRDHPTVADQLTTEEYVDLDHIQIAPRGQPGGYIDDTLGALGHRRRVARALPFFHSALRLVSQTDYILTVSQRIALRLAPSLQLKLLSPPQELDLKPYALSMYWHPRHQEDPAHQWLRQQLLNAASLLEGPTHDNPRRKLDHTDPTTGQGRKRPRK